MSDALKDMKEIVWECHNLECKYHRVKSGHCSRYEQSDLIYCKYLQRQAINTKENDMEKYKVNGNGRKVVPMHSISRNLDTGTVVSPAKDLSIPPIADRTVRKLYDDTAQILAWGYYRTIEAAQTVDT